MYINSTVLVDVYSIQQCVVYFICCL